MTTLIVPQRKRLNISMCSDLPMELRYHYYAGYPAKRSGHPDTWAPAEPDELYIESVHLVKDGEVSPDLLPFLPDEAIDELYADLLDELRNYP